MPGLPRVTYSNIALDLSGVHARLDEAIARFQDAALGKVVRSRANGVDLPTQTEHPLTSPIDERIVLARSRIIRTSTEIGRASWRDRGEFRV
jgi:hypothetical protein